MRLCDCHLSGAREFSPKQGKLIVMLCRRTNEKLAFLFNRLSGRKPPRPSLILRVTNSYAQNLSGFQSQPFGERYATSGSGRQEKNGVWISASPPSSISSIFGSPANLGILLYHLYHFLQSQMWQGFAVVQVAFFGCADLSRPVPHGVVLLPHAIRQPEKKISSRLAIPERCIPLRYAHPVCRLLITRRYPVCFNFESSLLLRVSIADAQSLSEASIGAPGLHKSPIGINIQ